VQRSILVLALALTVVILLTALLLVDFQESDNAATKPMTPWRGTARITPPGEASVPNDNPETLKTLGIVAYREKDYDAAVSYLKKYRDSRPDQVEAYTFLAISLLGQGHPEAAREVAETGINRPDITSKGPAHFVLACILANQQRTAEASKELDTAYDELGPALLQFANNPWASALREIPAYKELVAKTQKAAALPAVVPPTVTP
jgi:tetratricopeptide (TPR) repeat protein